MVPSGAAVHTGASSQAAGPSHLPPLSLHLPFLSPHNLHFFRVGLLQELANAYGRCEVNLRSGESVQNMLYAVLRLKPPPRWVPKTSVFNSKPDAVRKAEIGPTNSDMLELMVDQSPAVKGTS